MTHPISFIEGLVLILFTLKLIDKINLGWFEIVGIIAFIVIVGRLVEWIFE